MTATVTFIRWRDACQEEAASPHTSLTESPLIELREVGFLLGETDDAVTIGMELDPDGAPSRWRLHVPKAMIIERRDVDVGKLFPGRKGRKKVDTKRTT
jgi:hypothetical protein